MYELLLSYTASGNANPSVLFSRKEISRNYSSIQASFGVIPRNSLFCSANNCRIY